MLIASGCEAFRSCRLATVLRWPLLPLRRFGLGLEARHLVDMSIEHAWCDLASHLLPVAKCLLTYDDG